MITLKYNSFMAYPFVQSFQKLSSQSFGMQTAYKIKLIGEKLMKQREKVQGEYRELVEKYATRDEKGEMVHPDPKDTNGFDVKPELMEEYKAAETAFGLREFTVNVSQLTVKELDRERRSIGTLSFNKRYRNIAYNEEEMAFREAWLRGQQEEVNGQRIDHPGCLDMERRGISACPQT